MRLLLSILLIGIVLAVPAVLLSDAAFAREAQDRTAGSRVGTEFVWPDDTVAAMPDDALKILTEAADSTGSNLVRTSIGSTETGRTQITHYVYLGQERTQLFGEFTLVEGRWLLPGESRSGSVVVSTARTGEAEKVGTPSVFADAYDLTFAPLRQAFDSLPTGGRYVIESPDDVATDRFLSIVSQRLIEAGMFDLTADALASDGSRATPRSEISLQLLPYPLVSVVALLVASILLRDGKRIGVMRLLGHSTVRIWFNVVGRLQLLAVLAALLLCGVILLLVPGVDAAFARALGMALLGVTAVSLGITSIVGLIVISRIQVGDLIKGRLQ